MLRMLGTAFVEEGGKYCIKVLMHLKFSNRKNTYFRKKIGQQQRGSNKLPLKISNYIKPSFYYDFVN
jgi:hypothetical protein